MLLMTVDQYKLYSEGKYNDVNVIIGTNSDEGSVFVRAMDPKHMQSPSRSVFGPLAVRALELYPGHRDSLEVYQFPVGPFPGDIVCLAIIYAGTTAIRNR